MNYYFNVVLINRNIERSYSGLVMNFIFINIQAIFPSNPSHLTKLELDLDLVALLHTGNLCSYCRRLVHQSYSGKFGQLKH
jgi:K+-transporting ATPase A subunit